MYLVNFVLQFISRKVFIEQLGADILGLNTTINSILQFLNIAELGIGTAIACTLYKPISENNTTEIAEIVSLQGFLYKRIAFLILSCGFVLMLFIPEIFAKTSLPLWYAYSTFLVLLFGTLLTYLVTYKQILLSASQQEYKVQLSYKLWLLVKVLLQILAVRYLQHGYIWWLVLEAVFAIIACYSLNIAIYKTFPFIGRINTSFEQLNVKYPSVRTKVSQLFFHKIASFALTQISPLILYAFTSLSMVTKYSNYTLITIGITSMLSAIFNGLNAGVGNLVAEGNKERILFVFRELFSSRFLIVGSCTICIYFLCNSFISLWVGVDFVLDKGVVLLMTIIFFMNTMRTIVDSYIQAYGLFQDIWAPIAEAILNIGISIILGKFLGLSGILLGVIISLFIIVFIWKPIMLFNKGFHESIKIYIVLYFKHLIVLSVTIAISQYMVKLGNLTYCSNFGEFIIKSIILLSSSTLIMGTLLYTVEDGMRCFIKRISSLIKKSFS